MKIFPIVKHQNSKHQISLRISDGIELHMSYSKYNKTNNVHTLSLRASGAVHLTGNLPTSCGI